MDKNNEQPNETKAPVEALCEVLDFLWPVEAEHYREQPAEAHIFHELARVANWLNGGDWDAAGYAQAWSVMPEMGWRVAGIAAKSPPPEAKLPRADNEPEATWVQEGGTRYRVQGRKPSVQVVVGWDRPMSTFFAQVWDVPEGASHHEEGNLLLWLGTSFHEVEDVDALAAAVRPFVTLPDIILSRLDGNAADF